MALRRMTSLASLALISTSLFAQGLETKAKPTDWEEVNFEFNSSILSDGYPTLLRIAELMKQHPDYKVKVEGHTDYVGSVAYNEKLALSRAETVKSFLVKYGASPGQVLTSGQGKRVPEVPNSTKEGRFINRRVVMQVTDGAGNIIADGTPNQVLTTLDDRLKKLEDCCNQILKKLDKLDEILAAIRDLKAENDRLKSDVAALKNKPDAPPPPTPVAPPSATDVAKATAAELDSRSKPNYLTVSANAGPTITPGEINFNGAARFFAPIGKSSAVQAQGEYLYYGGSNNPEGRQEGQFDIGLVHRMANVQAGAFSSFKYANLRQYSNGGVLGQAAFTLDYLFSRGRVGFFGTKGFKNEAAIAQTQLGPSSYLETYLRIIDQVGGSAQVGLYGNAYLEGNLGYLHRPGRDGRPGGMIRFVHPLSSQLAFTVEGGLNETLLASANRGRIVFGLQFGNWARPKDNHLTTNPVPVDIPRVRYEVLTRKIGNSTPVADAGPDQIGVAPGTISLNGSGSYDPDGDPLTYQWEQVGGPTVAITGVNTATATFPAAEGATYIFRLTVTDPGGLFSRARVTVTTRAVDIRILRFQASPNAIRAGQSSTISWEIENADSAEITGIGNVNAKNGTSSVAPTETTVYRLTARNNAGKEVSETVTVTVERPSLRIQYFYAQPATILPGEASTLNWGVENATNVTITSIGSVAPTGTSTVTPAQTTTYTLTATGLGQTQTATVTVTVQPGQAPRIIRFAVSPVEVLPGEQASLVWQVEGATDVTITPTPGNVEPQGTSTVSPTVPTTYTITAKNSFGEVSSTAVLGIIAPVKILDFVADPPVVEEGSPVTLRWSTENATDTVITGVGQVPANGTVVVRPTADTSYTLLAYGDRSQASAFVLVKVVPKKGANRPPVAITSPDQSIDRTSTEIDGIRSFDPDGDPITYQWKYVSWRPDPKSQAGPPPTVSFSNANAAATTVTMSQWGTYTFELIVTDTSGLTSSAFMQVTRVDP